MCIKGWQVCVKFKGPMEMIEWDKNFHVEQNIVDYIGFKTFFRPMGLLDMAF
jgi:hypothetical protein